MAFALREGIPHKANGEFAYHVLDVLNTISRSAKKGKYLKVKSACIRSSPIDTSIFD
jgi:hypothetical protein